MNQLTYRMALTRNDELMRQAAARRSISEMSGTRSALSALRRLTPGLRGLVASRRPAFLG
jgi:hypothetical protein